MSHEVKEPDLLRVFDSADSLELNNLRLVAQLEEMHIPTSLCLLIKDYALPDSILVHWAHWSCCPTDLCLLPTRILAILCNLCNSNKINHHFFETEELDTDTWDQVLCCVCKDVNYSAIKVIQKIQIVGSMNKQDVVPSGLEKLRKVWEELPEFLFQFSNIYRQLNIKEDQMLLKLLKEVDDYVGDTGA